MICVFFVHINCVTVTLVYKGIFVSVWPSSDYRVSRLPYGEQFPRETASSRPIYSSQLTKIFLWDEVFEQKNWLLTGHARKSESKFDQCNLHHDENPAVTQGDFVITIL